jgi:hypothetical protein
MVQGTNVMLTEQQEKKHLPCINRSCFQTGDELYLSRRINNFFSEILSLMFFIGIGGFFTQSNSLSFSVALVLLKGLDIYSILYYNV